MDNRKYKVLILEDEQAWVDDMKICINQSEDFEVVKVTSSETEAIEFTKAYLPDAVIVDLELHSDESQGDGLAFLERLTAPAENVSKQPYKLAVTGVASAKTLAKLKNGLADFTYRKQVLGNDPEQILKHLRSMSEVFNCDDDYQTFNKKHRESLLDRETLITARINAELDRYSINHSAVGKDYVVEAIYKVISHSAPEKPQMKVILAEIGEKEGKDAHTINMAIDRFVKTAFSKTSDDELRKLYPANYDMERGAPTNMDFIFYIADKIKRENIC